VANGAQIDEPVLVFQSSLPVAVSSAYKVPPRSLVKTIPVAVIRAPPLRGVGQRHSPAHLPGGHVDGRHDAGSVIALGQGADRVRLGWGCIPGARSSVSTGRIRRYWDHEEVGFRVIRAAEPLDSAAVVRTPRRSLQGRRIVESLLLADREAMNQLTARLVENEEVAGLSPMATRSRDVPPTSPEKSTGTIAGSPSWCHFLRSW